MKEIDIKLKAKNSSGEQTLWLITDEGEYYFCLAGEYEGKEIQIDFEEMTISDLEDMKAAIELILEKESA